MQVEGFTENVHKSFKTMAEAEKYLQAMKVLRMERG